MFYKLQKDKLKSDYASYNPTTLLHTNKILEAFSQCAYYKDDNTDKLYKIYNYYFEGKVNLNNETGLVDEVIFTCIDNHINYDKANNF